MRHYKVRRAADVTRDLDLIEEHLVKGYQEFGEDLKTAVERATARIDDAFLYARHSSRIRTGPRNTQKFGRAFAP